MTEIDGHKVLERSQVSPAAPLDPSRTSLPLTFFDLSLAGPVYVRRQFFYHFPNLSHHFIQNTIPALKHSLSLTLQHFFPLAGNLICPPAPHKPFIRSTSHDAVTLTVLESCADFKHLTANHPKSLGVLDHLVPKLTCSVHDDDTFIFPLVGLQVTLFPNHGLCIAITYCHVMDDSSCGHFMKSWASVCKSGGDDLSFLEKSPPCYDREVIKDTQGVEAIFLRDYFSERSAWKDTLVGQTSQLDVGEDYAKATFVFGKNDIDKLKRWALNQWKKSEGSNAPQYLSKFVVTCAFVWTSLVKTRYKNEEEEEEKEEYFRFSADCRNRLEYQIPETYFGNCLTRCHAELKRKDIKGEGGFSKAVMVIERAITDMKKEPFKGAEKWRADFIKMFMLGSTVLVTGSPKFSVYETDFGFGRPTKVEMVHSFKGISLAESGDEEGGLEVGLVLRKDEFDEFVSVIGRELEALKS